MMVCVFWTPPKHEIRCQYLHIGSRYERYVLMIASCLVFFLKISLVSICFYVCFVVAVFIVYGIESQGCCWNLEVVESSSTPNLAEALHARSIIVFMKEAAGAASQEMTRRIVGGNFDDYEYSMLDIQTSSKFFMVRRELFGWWSVHIHLVYVLHCTFILIFGPSFYVLCIDSW